MGLTVEGLRFDFGGFRKTGARGRLHLRGTWSSGYLAFRESEPGVMLYSQAPARLVLRAARPVDAGEELMDSRGPTIFVCCTFACMRACMSVCRCVYATSVPM